MNDKILEIIRNPDEMTVEEINELRSQFDLPPLKPGRVTCLRCDREFESWDVASNRICRTCKEDPPDDVDDAFPDCDMTTSFDVLLEITDVHTFLNSWGMRDRKILVSGNTFISLEGT